MPRGCQAFPLTTPGSGNARKRLPFVKRLSSRLSLALVRVGTFDPIAY